MAVSRRFFLTSSCGVVVAVAASQLIVTRFFENTQYSKGASSLSLNEIFDENKQTITFERYVTREFMLNTNYLTHKAEHYQGLRFVPFEVHQRSSVA